MKVSEKSLELNVGAELLDMLRWRLGMHTAYLRGLTQREESREGVDFFAELSPATRIFAFQFKAPKGQWGDILPYRFTIQRHQHTALSSLASNWPEAVHYVLPFYVRPAKLRYEVPHLLWDTWLLPVAATLGTDVFRRYESRTVRCTRGVASINPDFELQRAAEIELGRDRPGLDRRVQSGPAARLDTGQSVFIARKENVYRNVRSGQTASLCSDPEPTTLPETGGNFAVEQAATLRGIGNRDDNLARADGFPSLVWGSSGGEKQPRVHLVQRQSR